MNRAQGATEFIIILAISLILVATTIVVFSDPFQQRQETDSSSQTVALLSGPVSVTEITVSPVHMRLGLQNNLDSVMTITKIETRTQSLSSASLPLRLVPGERQTIDTYDILRDIGQQINEHITITYEANGIEKRTNQFQVAQDISELENYEIRLDESLAEDMIFLARFNVDSSIGETANTFVDTVNRKQATCAGAQCPTHNDDGFTKSAQFDGQNTYLTFDTALPEINDTFSVSFWTQATNVGHILFIGNKVKGKNIERVTANRFRYIIWDEGAGAHITLTHPDATYDKWHHVVLTFNDNTLSTYANSQNIHDRSVDVEDILPFFPEINIGGVSEDTPFEGLIDEVAIWNRTLTQSEINSLYKRGQVHFGLE